MYKNQIDYNLFYPKSINYILFQVTCVHLDVVYIVITPLADCITVGLLDM